ncbi:amino acid permease [Phenylobacterium sp.]|uniref:amino acid permease n=1 Tax=Phenylobacterium sp. TaxID=1871053 RepID=UPI0025FE94A9|nr:amino acid permease [Phenylobacterium sp.]
MDETHEPLAREAGLHRSLTSGQLSMIAIGGAIGTGLFLGSGFAIGIAGPSVLVSYAIGGVIALLLMGALAEMTVAQPTAGSFGVYAEEFLGPLAGFLVRYAYWSCLVLAVGTEVTAVALYMKFWLPDAPGWWWVAGFSAGLVAINAVSVRVFGTLEYVFSLIKVVAIVAFVVLGAAVVFGARPESGIGFSNYVAHGGFLPNGAWGMWVAVILAIFSYLSIEVIAVGRARQASPGGR